MAGETPHRGHPLFAGLLFGFLLGLVSAVLAPIALALVPLAVLAGAMELRAARFDRSRLAGVAGVLLGVGAVLMFGALNTFAACSGTEDFCGNANVVPLFAFALVTLACGASAAILTVVRPNQQQPPG